MVIQRISDEEAEKLVEEIRSQMPYGPGNLSEKEIPKELLNEIESITSKDEEELEQLEKEKNALKLLGVKELISELIPVEARRTFNSANHLRSYWLLYGRDQDNTIRDVLYRLSNSDTPKDKSVPQYIKDSENEDAVKIGQYRSSIGKTAIDKWNNLFNIALYDFARQKTGGGSCDYYSAGMFLKLASQYPDAKISIDHYAPKSDTHKITPPSEEKRFHRVVFMEEGGKRHMLDPWFPGGKSVAITEESKEDYPERETIIEWNPNDATFMNALWIELELRYENIKEAFLNDKTGDSVGAVWTVVKKN
jgi:hypothetical protein